MKTKATRTKRDRKTCQYYFYYDWHKCSHDELSTEICYGVCKFYEPKAIKKVSVSNGM